MVYSRVGGILYVYEDMAGCLATIEEKRLLIKNQNKQTQRMKQIIERL